MSLLDLFGRSKPQGLPTLTPEQRQHIQDLLQERIDAEHELEEQYDLELEESQRQARWGEDLRETIIADGHVITGRIIASE